MGWIGEGVRREPQQGRMTVAAGVTLGTVVGWLVFLALVRALPEPADPDAALAWAVLPPALVVFVLSVAVGVGRFLAPGIDPTAGRDRRFVQVTNRALQNSVEQGLVFALAGIALLTVGAPEMQAAAPAFAVLFVSARLFFWLGYLHDPLWRSPGMAVTFQLNLVLIVGALLGS
jgi:uncharacterized MAPEG superfamily protein